MLFVRWSEMVGLREQGDPSPVSGLRRQCVPEPYANANAISQSFRLLMDVHSDDVKHLVCESAVSRDWSSPDKNLQLISAAILSDVTLTAACAGCDTLGKAFDKPPFWVYPRCCRGCSFRAEGSGIELYA